MTFEKKGYRQAQVLLSVGTLLFLELLSESEGENIVHFIQCHCPLHMKLKAKLFTGGNFSLKQRVKTSKLVNFHLTL